MSMAVHAISTGPMTPIILAVVSNVAKKILIFVKNHFQIMQWSFLIAYGAKEILFDRVSDFSKNSKSAKPNLANRTNIFLNRVFLKTESFLGPINYNIMHGALYSASGFIGSAAAMHHLQWVDVGSAAGPLEMAGNATFAFASFVSLVHNIKIYFEALRVRDNAPLHEREAANRLKDSAGLGIISSLNYIVAAASLMMNAAALISLIFGCIAVFTGCIKILYDFIRFRHAY